MSSTSFITFALLIKTWILGILFYLIRTTSSEFNIAPRVEILLYLTVAALILTSNSIFGISLGSNNATEMSRQESDLVKDYLKHRSPGETLGDYLLRAEAEEEEHQQRQSQQQQQTSRHGRSLRKQRRKITSSNQLS